jgi:transposase
MAKGKYEYWLTADGLLRLEAYARDGLTDDDISTKLGINRSTLYDWIKKYPDISNALKRGKEVVDVEVENALLQKAMGIKETVQRAIKLKEVLYENGKRVSEKERIEYADEEVYIPPDTTAAIFWLKNRKPAEWRDKQEFEHTGKDGGPIQYEDMTPEERKSRIEELLNKK